MKEKVFQKLPSSKLAREALRQKGQFWTPEWVANAMVRYALGGGAESLFDPAVGAGAFFKAAKVLEVDSGRSFTLAGTEVDPNALDEARQGGLSEADLSKVQLRDFVLDPPTGHFQAIVANPPYIRHHRLDARTKQALKKLAYVAVGKKLDGRAGLHVYFLIRALQLLAPKGRLAFIVPADMCEGVYASALWRWISSKYRLEAVATFTPGASPFPNVDTNPVILFIRHEAPTDYFYWARCGSPDSVQLTHWVASDFTLEADELDVKHRSLDEGLSTGLSRPPSASAPGPTLADFAKVSRGVATGANKFFFLTRGQAREAGIPPELLLPAIGRTRDAPGDKLTSEVLEDLEERGRPTLLFSPDGRSKDAFTRAVQEYIAKGEAMELNKRSLISTRRPWYKMEVRKPPRILFAYLGRRNARFIRNYAGAVPLTGFLCVYPQDESPENVDRLCEVLWHPETVDNLLLVGKSYGAGAVKVEPRALERLPLPFHVVESAGLQPILHAQLPLL